MSRIKIILAGAAGGIIFGIACIAIILSIVTAGREGPGAGIAVLITSPLYFFLYIVAFVNTLLPAGLITGTAAGLGVSYLSRQWSIVLASLSGTISGGYFGSRFTTIFLEGRGSMPDIITGGITAGIVLTASGALICSFLYRSFKKVTDNNRHTNTTI